MGVLPFFVAYFWEPGESKKICIHVDIMSRVSDFVLCARARDYT